jgi:hypothetical protein
MPQPPADGAFRAMPPVSSGKAARLLPDGELTQKTHRRQRPIRALRHIRAIARKELLP